MSRADDTGFWCLYRGREDGKRWGVTEASYYELAEWSDLPAFLHYMGAVPFPYDIEAAVGRYEQAKRDAHDSGMVFNHRHYATGFLESVYEIWHQDRLEPEGR